MRPSIIRIYCNSVQPGFTLITDQVQDALCQWKAASGILHVFCMHTSCALMINEAFDPSAKSDLEKFLDHLAPQHLPFIQHTMEGPDDSPAHMKTALLNQHLTLPVVDGELLMGRWQGIFLAEFRNGNNKREVLLKYQPD